MSVASDDPTGLTKAIAKKLDVSRQRVGQLEKAIRESAPMQREEALGVLGHQNGIDLRPFLTGETIRSVRSILSSLPDAGPAARPPKRQKDANGHSEQALRDQVRALRAQVRAAKKGMRVDIRDDQLRERCADLLKGRRNHDRAINQALQVLEDRVRRASGEPKNSVGQKLVSAAIGKVGPLIFSDVDAEQDGARLLFLGMYGFLRNASHHRLDDWALEDATAVVLFVDYLLREVDAAAAGGQSV